MEREALLVQLQRSKTGLRTSKTRCKTFWDRVAAQEESDKLRMEAQQQVWAEHRDSHEQACLHPLSTCIAELRRWQGVQRAAHERKCIQIRSQCEHEEGNLQWAIFCARLAHDSFGALSAAPLSAEQVRVCDAAAAANLQPRTKSAKENGSSRAFTVLRAAAISVARGAASASGMVSARSTRGLACSELCQTREHLEHLLSRALSGALLVAEAGASSTASSTLSAVVPASTTGKDGKEGTPQRGRKEGRGGAADKVRPASPGAQKTVSERMSGWSAQGEDGGGGDGNKLDLSNVLPSSFLPPGKRMPLFPRSMRLSSDCLGWLHASQRSASDMHVYFVAEELEAPPLRARDGAAAKRPAGRSTRTVAERLAASAEVNAVSVAGADLRVLLPAEDRNEEPVVHLRPASVEHLLAVDCVWPKMSEADRQVLHGCYTPRDSTLTGKLTTLYIPLSDGPQTEIDVELGTVRRYELPLAICLLHRAQTSALKATPCCAVLPTGYVRCARPSFRSSYVSTSCASRSLLQRHLRYLSHLPTTSGSLSCE